MALKKRLVSSSETTSCEERYVSYEEVFVPTDKGRKEVRYYLKKKNGGSDLALIGKEKSSRHMSYHYAIRKSSLAPFFKLKSRREVLDWLDSIVQDFSNGDANMVEGKPGFEPAEIGTLKDNQLPKLRLCTKEFAWLGSPWTCKKRRYHYESFKRNGLQISVNDFVFVLAEENKRLVAYLEDMYEDSRGNKMVVVRWFHRIDEVGIALPHSFSEREVYFSLYLQDLSIECIDGLTSVLSPQHYEKYRNEACHARPEPFVCRKKFDDDDVKPFDITQIKGYWKQEILKSLNPQSDSKSNRSSGKSEDSQDLEENLQSSSAIRPKKKQRFTKVDGKDAVDLVSLPSENLSNFKIEAKTSSGNNSLKPVVSSKLPTIKETNEAASQYLAVGSQVEVLSQDSGIRGCWFRASVIKKHKDKVKVQYHDIQDADDEAKKLEEWILASKIVLLDDISLRVPERTKIRPQLNKRGMSFVGDVGYVVDAWWHDGWWEGIVVQKESDIKYHVYFPGEKKLLIFGPGNLRHSQDWTGNGWVKVRERPDLVASILSSLKTKQKLCKSFNRKATVAAMGDGIQSKQADTFLGSSESNELRNADVVPDLLKDVLFSELRWKSSRKRNRSGTSQQKQQSNDRHSRLSPKFLESDATESFVIPASLKVDHDDCKYPGDPSIFSSSVVPSLTNMVMCM
ncbi:uncharacterized protein LOC123911674 isoform X2 [Trifolium pratense]|uniref:uncharacterized protein LOC123911674 isoform X2 n=1 Tax=Trifolium pratense TaxID=57577 RepID=UPI001E6941D7|nr:uncharacterized protein LOC123911674 isoform X2 [Trifolium pratense]